MASKGSSGRGGAPYSNTTGTSPFPQIPQGKKITDPPHRPAQGLKTPTKAPVFRDETSAVKSTNQPFTAPSRPVSGIKPGQ